MAGRTVYDPVDPMRHTEWALRQEQLEGMQKAGMISPEGALESKTASAAKVQAVEPRPSAFDQMWGINIRTTVSLFEEPKGFDAMRIFAPYCAPSLGSRPMREASLEVIREMMSESHPGETSLVEQEGLKISLAIDQTLDDDKMVDEVRGRIGELVSEK
jgi:Family of unknown function (DUF5399)